MQWPKTRLKPSILLLKCSQQGSTFVLFDDSRSNRSRREVRGLSLETLTLDTPTLVEERPEEKADDDFIEVESLDKTHDPVRLYLREMGSVPLLNRDGEIDIARRIERGQTKTRRILSRCPVIIQEMVRLGEDVRSGAVSARDILQFNDPIPTDETYEAGAQAMLASVRRTGEAAQTISQY